MWVFPKANKWSFNLSNSPFNDVLTKFQKVVETVSHIFIVPSWSDFKSPERNKSEVWRTFDSWLWICSIVALLFVQLKIGIVFENFSGILYSVFTNVCYVLEWFCRWNFRLRTTYALDLWYDEKYCQCFTAPKI